MGKMKKKEENKTKENMCVTGRERGRERERKRERKRERLR